MLEKKVVLKIKSTKKTKSMIKVKFINAAENRVTKYIPCFNNGDPIKNLILRHLKMVKCGKRYDQFKDRDWEVLVQDYSRALDGQALQYYKELNEDL